MGRCVTITYHVSKTKNSWGISFTNAPNKPFFSGKKEENSQRLERRETVCQSGGYSCMPKGKPEPTGAKGAGISVPAQEKLKVC